jgi:hypothetical protein
VNRPPISRAPAHGAIQLTSADADAIFVVATGQIVQLTLSDRGVQWGPVTVTPAGPLVAAPAPAPSPQGRLAVWVAAKPGTAKVTSVATAYCPAGTACPMWARLFAVTLVIS